MISIKKLVEDTDTWYGKTFDLLIQFLIIVSIVTFSIETIPTLSAELRRILRVIEIVCVIVFTA